MLIYNQETASRISIITLEYDGEQVTCDIPMKATRTNDVRFQVHSTSEAADRRHIASLATEAMQASGLSAHRFRGLGHLLKGRKHPPIF